MTDIDIDFAETTTIMQVLDGLSCVYAVLRGKRRRHPNGVYFQNIPIDPIDEMAVWDYKVADAKGYFKVDLLHNHIYNDVRDQQHLDDLLHREPPWAAFEDRTIVAKLAQLKHHFKVIQTIKPKSIADLAVCLALVRPGKRYLIGRPRQEIDQQLWLPPSDSKIYAFKRSHAVAYAASIVVQLNLLREHAAL